MTGQTLSDRGVEASRAQAGVNEIWAILQDLWDPTTNPNGFVSLGVADNSLMHNELRDFLNQKSLVDSESRGLTYGDGPAGSIPVRKALSSFMNWYFNPVMPVKPEHVMVTNGLTAAIEHSSWAFANPGDGILLGRPYYRAFLADIGWRTGVKVVAVAYGDVDPCGEDCVNKYEEALLKSNEDGIKVKALMLCHPHNPLGRCYPKETIVALMKMCQKFQIHLISDEIYALSVWENTIDSLETPPTPFESVLSVDTEGIIDPSLVHVLWGFSKDFGANGIRIGAIVSQSNDAFLDACRTSSLFSSPSSLAELAVVEVLKDTAFVETYIKTNQQRLSAAYAHAVRTIRRYNIEHKPGVNAAFFLWVNLGKRYKELRNNGVYSESSEDVTKEIYGKLKEKKVYVVPGDAAGTEQSGWFRLVFSQTPELVDEGVKRIAAALES